MARFQLKTFKQTETGEVTHDYPIPDICYECTSKFYVMITEVFTGHMNCLPFSVTQNY